MIDGCGGIRILSFMFAFIKRSLIFLLRHNSNNQHDSEVSEVICTSSHDASGITIPKSPGKYEMDWKPDELHDFVPKTVPCFQ